MRVVVTLIAILFTATVVRAQTPTTPQAPDLQIVKYSWTKDRIDWEKNPHGRRTEISDVRSRRGSILEEREAREQKARQEKPTEPPRYAFDYKLTVVNAGSKAIKEIEWDYVFTDAATGEELGRREFTSVERSAPANAKNSRSCSPRHRLGESALTRSARMSGRGFSSKLLSSASSTMTAPPGRPIDEAEA